MKSINCSSLRTILTFGLVALFVQSAWAHTYLSSVVLDGVALAEFDCVRPHPTVAKDSPITLVSSVNMTCGFLPQAAEAANRACPITAGSSIGIQWHHENDLPTDDILDPSHKGPVLFYLAKSDSGEGDVWFKIYEAGYDFTTETWATDTLIANDGLITITIPGNIEPGNYLLRGEVLALHQAEVLDGVQPYVGCVELTITGSGTNNPSATGVAFPGAYLDTDPGILFNIYTTFTSYPIPGPALYVDSSDEAESGSADPPSNPTNPPTSAPSNPSNPTSAPTNPPTSAPSNPSNPASGASLSVQMNQGSSAWWLGVIVSGGSQATSKVEIMDSGSVTTWTALTALSYAYVFSESIQLTLPISVRLTSSSSDQVILTNVFTSWSTTAINTGTNYGSSSSTPATVAPTHAPTNAPTATHAPTATPTHAATNAPTSAPTHAATAAPSSGSSSSSSSSSGSVSVTVYPTASQWWFALTVGGVAADTIASVELKDSGSMTTYALMSYNTWGYSLPAQGVAFVAPLTVRITNEAGQSATATISSITPSSVVSVSGSL